MAAFVAPKPKRGLGASFVCAAAPNGEKPPGFEAPPNVDAVFPKGDWVGVADDAAPKADAAAGDDVELEVPGALGAPNLNEKPGAGDALDEADVGAVVLWDAPNGDGFEFLLVDEVAPAANGAPNGNAF